MRRSLCILIIVLASAAPAQAATVDVVADDFPDPDAGTTQLRYRAASGEANRVTLSGDRMTAIVRDTGARLVVGRNCRSRPDGAAICDIRHAETAEIKLGDGDDEARLTSTLPQFGSVQVFGGVGHDTLSGGAGIDYLYGDGGRDVLRGNGGDDGLADNDGRAGAGDADTLDGGAGRDRVDYAERTTPIAVDLQTGSGPDGDVLAGIEDISGSEFDDDLRGSEAANAVQGGAGADRIEGRGGDDEINASDGDDVLLGGDGDDTVSGDLGRDTVELGAGEDRFDRGPSIDAAVDRVTCGGGRDVIVGGAYTDRYARDCEFLSNASPVPPAAELSVRPRMLGHGRVSFHAVCRPQGCRARLELYVYRRGARHGRSLGRSPVRILPGATGAVLTVRIHAARRSGLRGRNVRVEAVLVIPAFASRGTVEFPVRIRL
ncbi:MAG: hypothetical protein M3376_00480 [Actinomycetota bacterium]|nr:hypothetical protein [Actinomycetota bacterium]